MQSFRNWVQAQKSEGILNKIKGLNKCYYLRKSEGWEANSTRKATILQLDSERIG